MSNQNEFSEMNLSTDIIDTLTVLGYTTPTEIQNKVIPYALEGRDIIGKSKTGSGKTAAYGIPVCELIDWEENAPQCIVLEPTRELAVQVKDELFNIGRKKRLKIPAVFGGMPVDKQKTLLKQKAHIVVATPGRLMDHIRRDNIKLHMVKYLVIDEADLMLDMGFLEDVEAIMKRLPKERVVMLFSATLGEKVQDLADRYMNNPVSIILESELDKVPDIKEFYIEVTEEEKYNSLLQVLVAENPEDAMIFCDTRDMVNVLYRKLSKEGIRCGMLHGEVEQRDRLRTIEAFREGRFRYLICTDVAARGVDFDNITHVINYDIPLAKETYVHRIGRTGRNGKSGIAVTICQAEDKRKLDIIKEYTNHHIELKSYENIKDVKNPRFWNKQKEEVVIKPKKGAKLDKNITKLSISGGKKSKLRPVDIVGTICSIQGIEAKDIGIIDIGDSISFVEILNGKGNKVASVLQNKTIKGKIRTVKVLRGR